MKPTKPVRVAAWSAVAVALAAVFAAYLRPDIAVDLANRFGLTLVGFLRDRRFNVYTGGERIALGDGG